MLADLGLGRIRVPLEQRDGGEHETRGAVPALKAVLLVVGLLHRVQVLTGGKPLDRLDARALGLDGKEEARADDLAVQVQGARVETVEGLATADELHPIQQAFHEQHGLQCGYCTPGLLLAAVDLLERNPDPTEEEIRDYLAGNVCRCTGYVGIVAAVQSRQPRSGREVLMARRRRSPTSVSGFSASRIPGFCAAGAATSTTSSSRERLHAAFLRSPHAHARVSRVDADAARALDGVVLVLTAEDVTEIPAIATGLPRDDVVANNRPVLPTDRVRFVGEPVACVVATSRYVAEDALQLIQADYERLPA